MLTENARRTFVRWLDKHIGQRLFKAIDKRLYRALPLGERFLHWLDPDANAPKGSLGQEVFRTLAKAVFIFVALIAAIMTVGGVAVTAVALCMLPIGFVVGLVGLSWELIRLLVGVDWQSVTLGSLSALAAIVMVAGYAQYLLFAKLLGFRGEEQARNLAFKAVLIFSTFPGGLHVLESLLGIESSQITAGVILGDFIGIIFSPTIIAFGALKAMQIAEHPVGEAVCSLIATNTASLQLSDVESFLLSLGHMAYNFLSEPLTKHSTV